MEKFEDINKGGELVPFKRFQEKQRERAAKPKKETNGNNLGEGEVISLDDPENEKERNELIRLFRLPEDVTPEGLEEVLRRAKLNLPLDASEQEVQKAEFEAAGENILSKEDE